MRVAAVLALSILAAPVWAQEASVVGTAILGGKRVELMSDNTWRFSEISAAKTCVPINTLLSFCGSTLTWTPTSAVGSDFTRLYRNGSRTYGGVIYEDIGSADGMDIEFMRNVVIENAAAFAGIAPGEVPIYGVEDVTVDDVPGETVMYGVNLGALKFVYQNTILNWDHHTMQFVVWTVGDELTDQAREMNADFLDSFDVVDPGDGK